MKIKDCFRRHKTLVAAIACISVIATAFIVGYYLNQLGYEFTPLEGFS